MWWEGSYFQRGLQTLKDKLLFIIVNPVGAPFIVQKIHQHLLLLILVMSLLQYFPLLFNFLFNNFILEAVSCLDCVLVVFILLGETGGGDISVAFWEKGFIANDSLTGDILPWLWGGFFSLGRVSFILFFVLLSWLPLLFFTLFTESFFLLFELDSLLHLLLLFFFIVITPLVTWFLLLYWFFVRGIGPYRF